MNSRISFVQRISNHVDGIIGEGAIDVWAGVIACQVASRWVCAELVIVAVVLGIKLEGVLQ